MSPPFQPAVLIFRGRGFISSLIRWQTRGEYAHAALLAPDGRIIEAYPGHGVRVRTEIDWRGVDMFTLDLSPERWQLAIEFALAQVGRGYDYWGVVRFIDRRNMPGNDKWFCSELVFEALLVAGVRLFERIEPWAVSPGLLAISPLLKSS